MDEKEKLLAEALGRIESLQTVIRAQEQTLTQHHLERSTGVKIEMHLLQKDRDEWKQRAELEQSKKEEAKRIAAEAIAAAEKANDLLKAECRISDARLKRAEAAERLETELTKLTE